MSDASEPGYEGHVVIVGIRNLDAPEGAGLLTLHFVHYPGSQQLTLWLPQSGYQSYGELSVMRGETVIERGPVRDRLNGSVQILFATLAWPPGDYTIVITHDGGWRHEAVLQKLDAGVAPPAPEPVAPAEEPSSGPIVYRDGFGNVIPDLDLEMRAKIQHDVARKFNRRLEYEGTYRAGTITYIDGDVKIRFAHEMGGGDVKFSIEIPTAEHWEGFTKTPLSERDEIVAFLAKRVRIEKASSWRYEITDEAIDFYER